MRFHAWWVFAALLMAGISAFATAAPPTLARGTIAYIDDKSVKIAQPDGTTVAASISPATTYSVVEPRRFDQIKPSDYVGVISVPGPNGTRTAEEIHIIPIKGLHEGTFPWDHHPQGAVSSAPPEMTNGNVAVHAEPSEMTNATVAASSVMELKVTYRGAALVNGKCIGLAAQGDAKACVGVATVEVPASTPIVAFVPAKPADAKVGLAVFATLIKGPNGKSIASSLVLEKNGVKPAL